MLLLALTLFGGAWAKQVDYDVQKGDQRWTFDVRWTDAADQRHHARYTLPARAVTQDLDEPLRFRKKEAARAQVEAIRAYDEQVKPEVKARVTAGGAVRITVTGRNRKAMRRTLKEAEAVGDRALDAWMDDNGFTTLRRNQIVPDHTRHVREYADDLAPVVEALGGPGASPRAFAELALGFVQSIPYEKRVRISDRYRRPLSLLGRNRGDCDSKTVLLLALMKEAWPEVDSAVIYVPGHAFGALALDPQPGDLRFRRDGRTWVVVEPVGPLEMPVGKAGGKSRRRVRVGAFTLREV